MSVLSKQPRSSGLDPRGEVGSLAHGAARQAQFLHVIDRDQARERFHAHLDLTPLGTERVSLSAALDRFLAEPVISPIDVPGFDRANVDGFALHAADTFEAMEERPRQLRLNDDVLAPGMRPRAAVTAGTATPIATGAMLPRGADAVLMIEHSEVREQPDGVLLEVTAAVAPGQHISFAGTDVARGETVLHAGQRLTSREIGVLAALGLNDVEVFRRPRVAILSTGNEVVAPGEALPIGAVYDSNGAIVAAAVRELGGEPVPLGIVPDDEAALDAALLRALDCDMVILSGGTSKGAGDLSYRAVGRLGPPGIVAHGVALKPGKPICLAVHAGKPVVILPGFPTSAIFTFHEFVAPVLRAFAGAPPEDAGTLPATLPLRINSEKGRTEYVLVSLVQGRDGMVAYPMGKGSGSVTAFSFADGFIAVDQHTEILDAGSSVQVRRLGEHLAPADLVVIGSHCLGLDVLLDVLHRRGLRVKTLHVGSMGGLAAARRGECDLAGVHLMDPESGAYNRPFLSPELELVPGYQRMQGIVYRPGDRRFEGQQSAEAAIAAASADPKCVMVNRNPGSGTRLLLDRLLEGAVPPGYGVQAKSHNAVAAAVAQGRADWGLAIESVAGLYGLGFLPVQREHYDFIVPVERRERPAVRAFVEALQAPEVQERLRTLGLVP